MLKQIVGLAVFILLMPDADARSSAEVRAFKRGHPCPATHSIHGKCPGYVVDHVIPLCAGGADKPSNMQWQEKAASKVKDKEEWRTCRELKKIAKPS
ncbi:MAG: HNH endonuclease signature motif containing protein [Pseudomonadota bacterium]